MSLRAFVADDSDYDVGAITEGINKWSFETSVDVIVSNCAKLTKSCVAQAAQADILFLDIEMPSMDGIEFARLVREKNENVAIVFVTNHSEFALTGYDVQAVGYIVKPIKSNQLKRVLDIAYKRIGAGSTGRIALNRRTATDYYLPDDIIYVEVQNHNCIVVTKKERITYSMSLAELKDALPSPPFVQCHRSYYINANHVKSCDRKSVAMSNGETALVSKRYFYELKEILIESMTKGY